MCGEIVNSQIKSSHLWTFYGSIILDAWMWHLDLEFHFKRRVVLGISNPSKCLLTSVCCSINNTKSPKFSSVNSHVFHESGKTPQASLPIDWISSSPLKQLSGDQPIQKYTIWYHGVQALRYQFWLLSKWSWNKETCISGWHVASNRSIPYSNSAVASCHPPGLMRNV